MQVKMQITSALGKMGSTKTDYDKQVCAHVVWSLFLSGSLYDARIRSLSFSLLAAAFMLAYMMQGLSFSYYQQSKLSSRLRF